MNKKVEIEHLIQESLHKLATIKIIIIWTKTKPNK